MPIFSLSEAWSLAAGPGPNKVTEILLRGELASIDQRATEHLMLPAIHSCEEAVMRIVVSLLFVCFSFAVSATAAEITPLAAVKSFKITANIPDEERVPERSLMGEDRLPTEEAEEPSVFEEPGPDALPENHEGLDELPPSAEDEYLPEVRPKAKAKKKSKRKIKKSKKRGKERKVHRSKKLKKRKALSNTRGANKSVKRSIRIKKETRARRNKWYPATITGPTRKTVKSVNKSWNAKAGYTKVRAFQKRESYRTRRLREFHNYTNHIVPFGY